MRLLAQLSIGLFAFSWVCSQAGCTSLVARQQAFHSPPAILADSSLEAAQLEAAQHELERAAALEEAGDNACVDAYFAACQMAWQALGFSGLHSAAGNCYNESLARLLFAADRFGRLDPAHGLVIRERNRQVLVPAVHHGFPWAATDFQSFRPPSTGRAGLLRRWYGGQGVGVPLVFQRVRNNALATEVRFYPERSPFGATAVLQFRRDLSTGDSSAALVFFNPLLHERLPAEDGELPLARDLSAPLETALEEMPRSYLAGFVQPGAEAATSRLSFLEPYQPGKIPVVVIHGLFSDPQSWGELVNDLRASRDFCRRYQLWVFRYPTGQGFLQSAAALRTELQAAFAALDPDRRDPALRQAVLIGHSMGGLIAKLQVTYSEELVWNRLANRPLEQIVTTEATRAQLAEACYFDPSPDVARVIFVASPHEGALPSSGIVGQGAALLVQPSPTQAALHEQLIRDNPDTFSAVFERRFPTSIDMLLPSSPLLAAMRQMRVRSGVTLHTVLGVWHPVSLHGPSDGVVSVHSASHPCCHSVLVINAKHGEIHRNLATSTEILRILGCSR